MCRWFTSTLLLGLIGASLLGCGNVGGASVPVVPPGKVNLRRSVELGTAEKRTLQYAVEMPGVLEAEQVTDIAAGVSGIVDEVLFREGEVVTPDTVLVLIDQKRFATQLEIAKANELRAVAALEQTKDAAKRAQDAKGAITEEERIRTYLAQKTADADLAGAQANRRLAEIQLDRSRVRPPYAGRVNLRKVTPGSYIEDKAAVATIADLTRIRLVGWVPESAAAAVRQRMTGNLALSCIDVVAKSLSASVSGLLPGQADQMLFFGLLSPQLSDVEFTLRAYPREKFFGRLFYLSTVANPDTHMFESKSQIMAGSADGKFQPGFSASVRYPLRTNPDACVVPEESVRPNEKGFIAFVPVQKNNLSGQTEWVAQARVLELGYREPGWVEVKNGIKPGEIIVRRGAEALEDGTPIQFSQSPGELQMPVQRTGSISPKS